MKNIEYTEPVVQTIQDQVNAVIYSTDHLIGFNLARTLAEHQLVVHLIHTELNEPFLPSPSPQVVQLQFDNLTTLDQQGADYVFCIFPHRKENAVFLSPIIATCRRQASKLLVVEEYGNPHLNSLLDFLKKEAADVDTRIVLVNTPYGPYFGNHPTGVVSRWLLSIYNHQAIVLPSRGQEVTAPLYIDDLCQGLIQAMFKTQTNHQVFVLASLENRPLLDMAHQIRDLVEETQGYSPTVDFSPTVEPLKNPPESLVAATQASISWEPQTSFEVGLRKVMAYLHDQSLPKLPQPVATTAKIDFMPPAIEPVETKPAIAQNHRLSPLNLAKSIESNKFKKHFRRVSIFVSLLSIVTILLLPAGLFWWNTNNGVKNLAGSVKKLEEGQPVQAKKMAVSAKNQFAGARAILGIYRPLSFILGEKINKYDRLTDLAGRMAEVSSDASDVVQDGQELYNYVLSDSSADFGDLITSLKSKLDLVYNEVSLVQVSLTNQSFSSSLESFENLNDIKTRLPKLKDRLQLAIALLEVVPKVVNTPQTTNLLVIVQDGTELRPTGGFANTYVLLSFRAGRLVDQKVDNISALDAKLDGHVEPPLALKKHMGEANWFLRDANWSPDFPTSSRQIQWFFEKETGRSVAGVLAIDTNLLHALIGATGPINLPITSQTVTDKNFFDVITQKDNNGVDNLTNFTNGLVQKMLQGQISLSALASSLSDGLTQNDLLINLNDTDLQAVVEKHNWSGSLKNPTCPPEFVDASCDSETFGLFEANVGVNKNNFFISRSINHEVQVADDGKINHHIDVTYTNQSPQPGVAGTYKTYTQMIVPVGTQVQATLDQIPLMVEENTLIAKTGLMEVGFYYEIPAGSQKHLLLNLQSPQILNTFDALSALSINWQKEPGTGIDPIYVSITYPSQLKATQISMPANSEPQKLQFNAQLSQDLVFASEFKQGK